jgi:hypothetical protein
MTHPKIHNISPNSGGSRLGGVSKRYDASRRQPYLEVLNLHLCSHDSLQLTPSSVDDPHQSSRRPYQETLVCGMDLAHDTFELLCHPLGIEETPHNVLLSFRPLGSACADLLQLPMHDEPCLQETSPRTYEVWVEIRDWSSGDTEDDRSAIDRASRSAVFCTSSPMLPMLPSFSNVVCTISAGKHRSKYRLTYLQSLDPLRGCRDRSFWSPDRTSVQDAVRQVEDGL